jgi:hypothetical protein
MQGDVQEGERGCYETQNTKRLAPATDEKADMWGPRGSALVCLASSSWPTRRWRSNELFPV